MKHHQNRRAKKTLDVTNIVDDYSDASRKYVTSNRWTRWLNTFGGFVLVVLLYQMKFQGRYLGFWWVIAIITAVLLCATTQRFTKSSASAQKRRNEAALKLTRVRAASGLGPLIEQLSLADARSRNRIAVSIMDLLPRLRESTVEAVEPRHWKMLGAILDVTYLFVHSRSNVTVEFYVRTLEALAAFGDDDAVPVMKRLSGIDATDSGLMRVRDCAAESLSKLQDRLARLSVGDNLLRPAGVNDSALLRPVRPSDIEGDSKDLLRPVN